MKNNMTELNMNEMEQVNGGISSMLVGDLPAELEGALAGLPVGVFSAEKLAELTRV